MYVDCRLTVTYVFNSMFIKSTHVYFFSDKSYKINKLKFEKKKNKA